MIEFQIKVDSRILQAILPQLEKTFGRASKSGGLAYACPNPMDEDFVEAWESGLKEEFLNDRKAWLVCFRTQSLSTGMSK
jgi:hypothetical protein